MLVVMSLVGALAVPAIVEVAQDIYIHLQADHNRRLSQGLAQFIENRAAAGMNKAAISKEVQAITANTDVDRGYSCVIDQTTRTYLNHPMPQAIGMAISSKKALFQYDMADQGRHKWEHVVPNIQRATGILTYADEVTGASVLQEIVAMYAIPRLQWVVSTHENMDRLQSELDALRSQILMSAAGLGFILALLASYASRKVSSQYERIIERQNEQLQIEWDKSDNLLLSILPRDIAAELKEHHTTAPHRYPSVSVLFADLVGFTDFAAAVTPERLVEVLNRIFNDFDELSFQY